MAETDGSLQQNHSLQSLIHALDPISLILSQNSSNSHEPVPLRLTTDNFYTMERGPRYKAYADLRESKLRFKKQETEQQQEYKASPLKKQVKFQEVSTMKRRGSSSVLTQSVPDFSATLRKENRKPTSSTLASVMELTPPTKKYNNNGVLSSCSARGSKSASSAGEKRGLLMARKSYASVEELKGLANAVGGAINAENRGGGGGGGGGRRGGKTVLGYRQF